MFCHIVSGDLIGDALVGEILDRPVEDPRRIRVLDGGREPGT